jgi:hypothetical protein
MYFVNIYKKIRIIYISVDYYSIFVYKMLVLFLFTTAVGLKLTQFKNYQIEFNANCTDYLVLQDRLNDNYLYLYQKNNQFELWLSQNRTYEVYTSPYSGNFKFEWPEKLVNGLKMNLVLQDGSIDYPMDFDSEDIMCTIKGITTNRPEEVKLEKLFKCLPSKDWIINMLAVGIIVLLAILFGVHHESIKIIFGPKISGIVWRIRKILSRGEKETSSSYQKSNWEIPEVPERLYSPQASAET